MHVQPMGMRLQLHMHGRLWHKRTTDTKLQSAYLTSLACCVYAQPVYTDWNLLAVTVSNLLVLTVDFKAYPCPVIPYVQNACTRIYHDYSQTVHVQLRRDMLRHSLLLVSWSLAPGLLLEPLLGGVPVGSYM